MHAISYQYLVMVHALPFSSFLALVLSGGNTSGWARHRSKGIKCLPTLIPKIIYELRRWRIAYHLMPASIVAFFWMAVLTFSLAYTVLFDRNFFLCFSSNAMHHLYSVVGASKRLRVWEPHWRRHRSALSLCQGECVCVSATALISSDWINWSVVPQTDPLLFLF